VIPVSRYIVFFSVAGGGCAVDLATKHWMFQWLGAPGAREAVPWVQCGKLFLGWETSLNEGALFGMAPGMWPLLALFSVAAAVGIFVYLFIVGAARHWWLTIALSSITAGIFGNLYDRLGLPGLVWAEGGRHHAGETVHAVRDFILMAVGDWHWPNYNVADSMLVCGAILFVCHSMLVKPDSKRAQDDAAMKSDGCEAKE
jgi:signal peptidase II